MPAPVKPPALKPGSRILVVSTASPVYPERLARGCDELRRLGFDVELGANVNARTGYFAGTESARLADLQAGLAAAGVDAVICSRGGYGTNALLEQLEAGELSAPRILVGYSDVTCLQAYLWQKVGWVGFYGPMAAAGFDGGPGKPSGYDEESFLHALTGTREGWSVPLAGTTLREGTAEGVLVGGCLTILRATIGTPWELDTTDSILLLEDRAMKPYQVDRALMHLRHAGKLSRVRGVILGDFPECEPPAGSEVGVREVVERVLGDLGVPVVFGAPFGHTARPMLTIPLGVRARLEGKGAGRLEMLEPAVA